MSWAGFYGTLDARHAAASGGRASSPPDIGGDGAIAAKAAGGGGGGGGGSGGGYDADGAMGMGIHLAVPRRVCEALNPNVMTRRHLCCRYDADDKDSRDGTEGDDDDDLEGGGGGAHAPLLPSAVGGAAPRRRGKN